MSQGKQDQKDGAVDAISEIWSKTKLVEAPPDAFINGKWLSEMSDDELEALRRQLGVEL